ncbi:MAG: polyprenol monophosphomannose synthase [Actinobacteria bacterium]|nr:MAG: polyprenol monophosphomannose synthase [Actinomycetota bacterium]
MSTHTTPPSCVLVLPTYNEIENIDRFIRAVRASTPNIHILIVDDNSPDGTGAAADNLALELGNIQVIHRTHERGLGSAYRTGFRRVLSQHFDNVITMDADFSHDPMIIPKFIGLLNEGADLVIGSRYCPGGSIINWPWYRTALSKWGNLYTRALLNVAVTDCTTGYRGYKMSSLQRIEIENVPGEGYVFLSTIITRAVDEKLKIVETPICFANREMGTSKMTWKIALESMILVTKLGLKRRIF